jgi:AcrR family transcriptional regulator
MRVTGETKVATRQRILDVARQQFASNGFDSSTTRALADAAGIATGTLFNYFPTKEAILASLVAEAVAEAHRDFEHSGQSLEEALFAFVAAELRKLKPLRKHLPVLFETILNPLASDFLQEGLSLRQMHLEIVTGLIKKHLQTELPGVELQLYWTLYTGVLMFWATDRSPRQEDTLALLDHSLAMFVGWLARADDLPASEKGGESCPRQSAT